MSEAKVIFNHRGNKYTILCKTMEKMRDIIQKYINKNPINLDEKFFLYNGKIINEELNFEKIINNEDKGRNSIEIIVVENENINNEYIIKSKEIICPGCKESTTIDIKNYQINLNKCKNKHRINNIILDKFEKIQNIDISKVICQKCGENNKGNAYKNIFYTCLNCNLNLCPLCHSSHDISHKVINYDFKNYICNKHCENFSKFCTNCKEDICINCENEHKNHNAIY